MKKAALFLICIIIMGILPVQVPIQAKTNDPIGYEINGDVVEIWNPDTVYYFNKTNGAQWVENPDRYWSRNVFGIGYYSDGEWVQMYSSDDLGIFNKEINSDFETYVTATLWRDFNYNGYDLRLGIEYHLELEDTDLSVTIYAKNIDYRTYPVPLGFSWTLTDIDIPNPLGQDTIYINGSDYRLNGVYDLSFSDMRHNENGTTVYDPHYRLYDYTEYLTLEWDETLSYSVKLKCNGVQEEARITLLVNAGIFQPSQEKQTTLLWADAEGDYTGIHWDTSSESNNPWGITTNGVYVWIVDAADDEVYRYYPDGTYIDSFDTTGHGGDPYGVATDNVNIYTVDPGTDTVYKWTMAGVYVSAFDISAKSGDGYGITTDGVNIWISDTGDDEIYKYTMAGVYVSS